MAGGIRRAFEGVMFAAFVVTPLVTGNALIGPALADDWESCAQDTGEAAIAACTRTVKSDRYTGRVLALAYNNRGVEWKGKGDFDRAIPTTPRR